MKLFFVVGLFCLLAACGTSRKTVVGVSGSQYEHAAITKHDSTHAVTERVDSIVLVSVDTSHVRQAVTERGTYDETIAERITETIDKEGRKTTTTDRTTNRRGSYDHQGVTDEWKRHVERDSRMIWERMDSINQALANVEVVHNANHDSLSENSDKSLWPTLDVWSQVKIFAMSWLLTAVFVGPVLWYFLNHRVSHEKETRL